MKICVGIISSFASCSLIGFIFIIFKAFLNLNLDLIIIWGLSSLLIILLMVVSILAYMSIRFLLDTLF